MSQLPASLDQSVAEVPSIVNEHAGVAAFRRSQVQPNLLLGNATLTDVTDADNDKDAT